MPELPATRRARLVDDWGISESDARILVATPRLAEYAEAAVVALRAGTAKDVANWCVGDVLAYLNESGLSPEVLPLAPDGLAELVDLVADGTLSRGQAKDVLAECLAGAQAPEAGRRRARAGAAQRRRRARHRDRRDHRGEPGATPTSIAIGDDKVRKKKRSFFIGQAMARHQGPGQSAAAQPPPR